jgi:hypothetical protein
MKCTIGQVTEKPNYPGIITLKQVHRLFLTLVLELEEQNNLISAEHTTGGGSNDIL